MTQEQIDDTCIDIKAIMAESIGETMHNDPHKLGKLVTEVQEHERKENEKELCMTSWVQPMVGSIILNGVGHSGSAVHVCNKPKHPPNEPCVCRCRVSQLTAK